MKRVTPLPRTKPKCKKLWQMGDLFHNSSRYPRKRGAPQIDRLAGILKNGIVAPAACDDGSVHSDLTILYEGAPIPYDRLVFLHRYDERSWLYTTSDPGRFTFFVDPDLPVITQDDMGKNWCILCQDEVYVRDKVAVEKLIGLAVHEEDVDSVVDEFKSDLKRLGIPVYLYDGTVIWPKK